MLNRLSRFASNLMICLLATVMLLGIGCLAGLTQEVNAATKVVRVDRKTEMDGKEFKNWVESSNRVHEGIHNVELINNWDVSSQQDDGMMVYASMNFYFNDYYIKGNNDDTLFWISDNVEINMYGNGPDSKIFNCGDYYEDGGVFNLDGSNIKLKLENVSIEENRADRGAAMYIGGYDNQVLLRDSYLNSNSVDDLGGAIFINAEGNTVTIDNSTIAYNTSEGDGGGIYVNDDENTICGENYARVYSNYSEEDGGGIYLCYDNNTVEDLDISYNEADERGGAIFSEDEYNDLIDLKIDYNYASEGGGIYVDDDCTLIRDCRITDNEASSSGGGVYVTTYIDTDFDFEGETVIKDNTAGGKASDVYFADSDIDDSYADYSGLAEGSEVGILYYDAESGKTISEKNGACDASYLFYDNDSYRITRRWDGYMMLYSSGTTLPVKVNDMLMTADEFALWSKEKTANWKGRIDLLDDVNVGRNIYFKSGCNVELYMNGHMIRRTDGSNSSHDSVIFFGDGGSKGGSLKIYGGNEDIRHKVYTYNKNSDRKTQEAYIYGGLITGGVADNNGGAIRMDGENLQLFLTDVYLMGNSADDDGGALYMESYAQTATLKNCRIDGNWAENSGGAVYMNDDRDTLILDGTKLYNNWAGEYGGAVYTSQTDAESMLIKGRNDAAIGFNRCEKDGGAIFLGDDKISVAGIRFLDNECKNKGGAIYIMEEGITVANCVMEGNKATGSDGLGGAIYIGDDANTISNCTITGNSAGSAGHGVYVEEDIDASFALAGNCVIKDNKGNDVDSNVYMADSDGDDSHVDISGLGDDADVHIGYNDYYDGMQVSEKPGTYNAKLVTCDNEGYYFKWNRDRDDRHLYMVKGSKPAPFAKTSVDAGRAVKVGEYEGYDLLRGYYEHNSSHNAANDTDVCFYYSDGYFDESKMPEDYNEHLATTTLNMAMSTFYSSYGGSTDYKGKHENARQFLSDIGCDDQDIYINDFYTEKPGTDTIGVIIAQKPLVKGTTDTGRILVPVAIRSQGYESEWASNATLGTEGDAKGFGGAATIAFEELEKYIAQYDLQDAVAEGKVVFWVTGFSRGGATANILSNKIAAKYANGGSRPGEDNTLFAYTFATPIGGVPDNATPSSPNFAIHNNINYADIVPLVAPAQLGFSRYGVDHYLPGTAAGDVKHYEGADENMHSVADNEPLVTKTAEYNDRFDRMLEQLKYVDPDIEYDDYFHGSEFSLMNIGFISADSFDTTVTGEKFERDLVEQLMRQNNMDSLIASSNRKHYADEKFRLRIGSSNRFREYETLENSFRTALGLVFGTDPETSEEITDKFGSIMGVIGTTGLIDIYINLLGNWKSMTDDEKASWCDVVWEYVDETGAFDSLEESKVQEIKSVFPTIVDMALNFADWDYRMNNHKRYGIEGNLVYVGTAMDNIGRLITNHFSEIYLAWARTYDSFYMNEDGTSKESKAYVLNEPSAQAPSAMIEKESKDETAEPEYITLSSSENNVLKGDQRIILDSRNRNGEAIYYTLENRTAGVTLDETIYRGGIDLTMVNGEASDYTITARAMQYGRTSEKKTYRIRLVDSGHMVKVVDNIFCYNEGETVAVTAPKEAEKFFYRWNVKLSNLGGDPDINVADNEEVARSMFGDDYADDLRSSAVSFIMPGEDCEWYDAEKYKDYDVIFEPVYATALGYLNIDGIYADGDAEEISIPVGGEKLPAEARISGDAGDIGSRNITDRIAWYYEDTDEETGETREIATGGNAYRNTVYIAKITLEQNADKGIYFSENIVKRGRVVISDGVAGAAVESVERSSADGSIVITVRFAETGDEGDERPDVARKLNIRAFDINQNPDEIEDGTHSALEVFEYDVAAGTKISITAPDVEDEKFYGWNVAKSGGLIAEADKNSRTVTITLPDIAEGSTYELYAGYVPVVRSFDVVIGEGKSGSAPVKDQPLPELSSVNVTIDNSYGIDPDDFTVTWSPEDAVAGYNTAYTATVKMKSPGEPIHVISVNGSAADETYAGVFCYAPDCTATINGEEAILIAADDSLTYTFPATERKTPQLVSVDMPADISGLPHGSGKADIEKKLPEMTSVQLDNGSVGYVKIEWNSVELTEGEGVEPLVYTAKGKAVLGEDILNENDVPLDVTMKISTVGADTCVAPTASYASGVYRSDFSVELTSEDGAKIYYTLDGDIDHPIEYTEPVMISRSADKIEDEVTLLAYASMDGKKDSSIATYIYTFSNTIGVPAVSDYEYDGEEHIGVPGGLGYTLTFTETPEDSGARIDEEGNAVAVEAGEYTVKAQLKRGCEWAAGYWTQADYEAGDCKQEDIGKEKTESGDKILVFRITDSADKYAEEILAKIRHIADLVDETESICEGEEELVEGIATPGKKVLGDLTIKYNKLKKYIAADPESAEAIAYARALRTEVKAEDQSAAEVRDNAEDAVKAIASIKDREKEMTEILTDVICSTPAEERQKIEDIKADLVGDAESAGKLIEAVAYVGERYELAEKNADQALAEFDRKHNDHTLTKVAAVKATTSRDGNIAYWECDECHKLFKDDRGENLTDLEGVTVPKAVIKLSKTSLVFTGLTRKPTITVKDANGNTISSANYATVNKGAKSVGTHSATIVLKNRYTGTYTRYYKIIPRSTHIRELAAGSKSFTVKWARQKYRMSGNRVTGYQVQYATSSKFTTGKTNVWVKGYTKNTRKVSSLKSGKTYYVRIRTYKKINDKTYYSNWCDVKKVRTK